MFFTLPVLSNFVYTVSSFSNAYTGTALKIITASIKNASVVTGASSYANGSLQEAALRVEAASDTSMVSVASGVSVTAGGQDKVSLALAGSGAVQNIKNTTKA